MIELFNANKPSRGYEPEEQLNEEQLNACNKDLWIRAMIEQFNANKPSRGYKPGVELNACNKDLWVRSMIEQFNAKIPHRGYEPDRAKSNLMFVTKIYGYEP